MGGGVELAEYVPRAFTGKMADYASWKKEWDWMIHSRVDLASELYLLRKYVPVDAQSELETL